jgi:hypothetical protein
MAIELVNEGAHLTTEGLTKIVAIKAAMNKGLSDKLKTSFTNQNIYFLYILIYIYYIYINLTPVNRAKVEDQKIKDPHWFVGFAEGEGSFYVRIQEAKTKKSVNRNRVSFFFAIGQHSYPVAER